MLQMDQRALLEKFREEDWTQERLLEWLIDGFRKTDIPASDAFSPLSIRFEMERTQQVTAAFLEIAKEDQKFAGILNRALQSYVQECIEDLKEYTPHTNYLWGLYGLFSKPETIENTARKALGQEVDNRLAPAIIQTMLLAKIPAERAVRFLRDLCDHGNASLGNGVYWHEAYFMNLVDASFRPLKDQSPAVRLATWKTLVATCGTQITGLTHETGAGRAAIRSVARQILGTQKLSDPAADAEELRILLMYPLVTVQQIRAATSQPA